MKWYETKHSNNTLMKKTLYLLLCGLLGVFATIGITRMSFGMILPLLEQDLSTNMTTLGFISSANFVGYFIGVLIANSLIVRFNITKLIIGVLLLEIFFMLAMIIANHYMLIALFYALVGVCSAIGYLSIMGYVVNNISNAYKGRALGVSISGNSVGIIISGVSVYLLAYFMNYSWQDNWLIFTISIAVSLVIIAIIFNNTKSSVQQKITSSISATAILKTRSFWHMSGVYFIFGAGYTIFLTFFVDFIITDFKINIAFSSYFWLILGATSLFSGPLFGLLADKTSVYHAFIFSYGLQALASVLLITIDYQWIIYVSSIFFGISVWAMPSLIFALSSEHFSQNNATKAASLATIVFALGQVIGPITGGIMYDMTLEYHTIFMLVFGINLLASVLSFGFYKSVAQN